MVDNLGHSYCSHCGAQYRLFSIFNKDMQGLTKAWKRRHERGCEKRTPQQRVTWAKPYIGKDRYESSIVVDLDHPGFNVKARMNKWKTDQEIEDELTKLRSLKCKVPHETAFGDNNQAAIDAQCSVLAERMDMDDVYKAFGDEGSDEFNQYVLDSAINARDWMTGDLAEDEDKPSDSWADAVRQ